MSNQHTPGPWKVKDGSPRAVETAVGPGYWISWSYIPFNPEQHGIYPEADARLIAAAPELLEVLEVLASYPVARSYPDGPCLEREDMKQVRAAIGKATGEVQP